METLEDRSVPTNITLSPQASPILATPIQPTQALTHPALDQTALHPALDVHHHTTAAKLTSIASSEIRLTGTWRANYVVTGYYGYPAPASITVRFLRTQPTHLFDSITSVTDTGLFGPSTYSFYAGGTWFFVRPNLIRMTIRHAAPTEYLNNGITVMDGQFLSVVFLSNNRFRSGNIIFNRVR